MLTVPHMSIEWGAQMSHFWWLNIVGSQTVPLVLQWYRECFGDFWWC
jgi:hypothetical protein